MKKYHFLIVLLFATSYSFGQIDFKQVVPPNPNVASLFKSVITPINEYSGLPGVSIPLCEVSEGNISVPISLSYATGGIQVSEESGIVGLGWALNAGGAITRSVRGEDDFAPTYGYLVHSRQAPDFPIINPDIPPFVDADSGCNFPVNGSSVYFQPPSGLARDFDFMPDLFHFNFNGYSGSFMFNPDGTTFMTDKQPIDIQIDGSGSTGYFNTVFKITTETGIVYEFGLRGRTEFPIGNLQDYDSTWYLTSISDTVGNTISLNYITQDTNGSTLFTEPLLSFNQSFETPTYSGPSSTNQSNQSGRKYFNSKGPQTQIDDFYLDEIVFDTGRVKLNYSAVGVRQDVKSRYLETLVLLDNGNVPIKTFDFSYSNFGNFFGNNASSYNSVSISNGDYAQEITALNQKYPDLNLRLRLDAVTENNDKKHSFEYYGPSVVPNKTTLSQDYWGYYNGANNRDSFIPELRDSLGLPLNYAQFIPASRIPNETFAKYFSLKKLTYPTKGSTEFDYELNTFDPSDNPNIITPPTVLIDRRPSASGGNRPVDSLTIRPDQNSTLYLDYSITLRGWNTLEAKPNLTTEDFQNLFYVEFRDLNGTLLSKQHIPSSEGFNAWNAYNPCTPTVTTNCSDPGQPAITFEISEEWKYNNPIGFYNLTEDEYQIKVYFNDLGGLLYGLADVRVRYEGVVGEDGKDFSIGGGLRVKSIIDRDNDESIATKRNFKYHYFEQVDGEQIEKSYGRLKTVPRYNASHRTVYMMKYLFTLSLQNYWGLESMPKIAGNATSQNSFSKDAGSYVGYDQVETTYDGSTGDNGKMIKYFFNEEDLFRQALNIPYRDDYYKFPPLRVPHNGVTLKEENYKREGSTYTLVSETNNEYEVNGLPGANFNLYNLYQNPDRLQSAVKENPITLHIEGGASITDCSSLKFQFHHDFSNIVQQTKSIQTIYDLNGGNPVTTTQQFAFENEVHLQRTKTTMTESDGSIVETKVYFPDDISSANSLPEGGPLNNFSYIELLNNDGQHQIAIPVQTVTKRDNQLISIQRTQFSVYGQYTSARTNLNADVVLPNITQTAKGTTPLEDRLVYEDYLMGKPIQMRKEDGTSISYIWGYNNTYPIAKIENATYDDIAAALGTSTSALKNYDHSNLPAINGLRSSHPEFMITTFTFDPLVGMTSTTDPRGYVMTYEYDELNRLKAVKDANNHLVTDYQYHYKGQNQQ